MKRILILCVATLSLLQSAYAQEEKKFELGAGASFGFSLGKNQPNSYGFDLFGGYKFNPHFTAGLGINYVNYAERADLPSLDSNLYITTTQYHAFRPFLYFRYDFLPEKKWTPYVGARVGYAFFPDASFNYRWANYQEGLQYGYVPAEYEHILTDPAHPLGIKNGIFGTIDLGVSRHIGSKGGKISFGVSLDFQPVRFQYDQTNQKSISTTIGPYVKMNF